MLQSVAGRKPVALIVDDEKSICDTLAGVLSDEGWDSLSALSGKDGIELYRNHNVDLVFLDVWMKRLDGIEALQRMKEIKKHVPIVVMSGHGTIETAVKVTKLGAHNFLEKPLSLEKILPLLEQAAQKSETIKPPTSFKEHSYELVGVSEAIAAVRRQITMISKRNSWVLISGENGTGKEVVARNVHLQSARADKKFVAVNCAAIPEELIESELFGHAKGAFTHATHTKIGRFELAHKGTLFLDEIGDMSLKTQAKILRILQEQSFQRLGDNNTISIDVRVIAATNKDLQAEIAHGNFREDLFYRLNVIPIYMTALRDRLSDIPPLCDYFLYRIAKEFQEPQKRLSKGAMEQLCKYHWPGNVRELKNIIERLCIMIEGPSISEEDVKGLFLKEPTMYDSAPENNSSRGTLKEARTQFERSFIVDKLEENEWNVSRTADAIGLERSHLHRKMRVYDIDMKRHRSI